MLECRLADIDRYTVTARRHWLRGRGVPLRLHACRRAYTSLQQSVCRARQDSDAHPSVSHILRLAVITRFIQKGCGDGGRQLRGGGADSIPLRSNTRVIFHRSVLSP